MRMKFNLYIMLLTFLSLFLCNASGECSPEAKVAVVVDAPLSVMENAEINKLLTRKLTDQLVLNGYTVLPIKGVRELVKSYLGNTSLNFKSGKDNYFTKKDLKKIADELEINNVFYLQLSAVNSTISCSNLASVTWDFRLYDRLKNTYLFAKSYSKDNIKQNWKKDYVSYSAAELLDIVLNNNFILDKADVMQLVNEKEYKFEE